MIRQILEAIAELEVKPSPGFGKEPKPHDKESIHAALIENGWRVRQSSVDGDVWTVEYAHPGIDDAAVTVWSHVDGSVVGNAFSLKKKGYSPTPHGATPEKVAYVTSKLLKGSVNAPNVSTHGASGVTTWSWGALKHLVGRIASDYPELGKWNVDIWSPHSSALDVEDWTKVKSAFEWMRDRYAGQLWVWGVFDEEVSVIIDLVKNDLIDGYTLASGEAPDDIAQMFGDLEKKNKKYEPGTPPYTVVYNVGHSTDTLGVFDDYTSAKLAAENWVAEENADLEPDDPKPATWMIIDADDERMEEE